MGFFDRKAILSYERASTSPFWRRKKLRRILIASTFILFGGIAIHIYNRCYIYDFILFRRTLNPSKYFDNVVFEEYNIGVNHTVESGGIVQQNSSFIFWYRNCPSELDQFWRHTFGSSGIAIYGKPVDIVFYGGLRTPSGKQRLVIIGWPSIAPKIEHVYSSHFVGCVVKDDSIWTAPCVVTDDILPSWNSSDEGVANNLAIFRIFFGHEDQNDLSSFVIPYSTNDRKGLIVGQLNEDDTIRLHFVSGPGLKIRSKIFDNYPIGTIGIK